MPAKKPARRPRRQPTARTSRDLGAAIREVREARDITQKEVATRAGLRPAQMSLIESGYNVESGHYTAIARVLGFRTALEMFRAHDPQTTTLLRLWDAMDPRVRETALAKLTAWLLED